MDYQPYLAAGFGGEASFEPSRGEMHRTRFTGFILRELQDWYST